MVEILSRVVEGDIRPVARDDGRDRGVRTGK
jgi:hypothetical protein